MTIVALWRRQSHLTLETSGPRIRTTRMTSPTTDFLDLQTALAGEYSLQRELGRGGMGIVYLARDVQLDRDVAIKVLPSHLARTPASRERFIREARTAAGLSHPHIVPIHRVVAGERFVFFVMSYVEGETLGDRLRTRGPLSATEATRVLREVAWALAYAHGRGIVHRDVKPDNILLEAATGRALVTDFGIAHGGSAAASDTDPGKIMGTAHFMSPEQAASESVDGRSDLYALGVVGFLAVSGRLPFEAANLPALLVRQATETPPSVLRAAPGVPQSLGAVIDRCLARERDDRFPDGETMAAALAPTSVARPALPAALRAWLSTQNPLFVPFAAWSGGFGLLTAANFVVWVTGNRPAGFGDIPLLAAVAAAPLLPTIGFHLNQARRQFRAGYSLADLRSALAVARRERAENAALVRDEDAKEPGGHRLLRLATVASGTWLASLFGLMLGGVVHERYLGRGIIGGSMLVMLVLAAVSNALEVQFIPTKLRSRLPTGVRARLWNSRLGEWLAKRLGAPDQSRAVGGGVFRATEVALGIAAADLFAALPKSYREQLAELPATVAALEARAAEARAELDLVAALGQAGASPGASDSTEHAHALEARRRAASSQLADTVAALEGVRLDLLRLHAGAGDLAPLTTLIDAARLLGEDVSRIAEARREVDGGV